MIRAIKSNRFIFEREGDYDFLFIFLKYTESAPFKLQKICMYIRVCADLIIQNQI